MQTTSLGRSPLREFFGGLLLVFFLLFSTSLMAQQPPERSWLRQTFEHIFNDTSSSAKPKFLAYPTIAYTPETSWEFGATALYVYYARQDTANRLSELNAFTFLTLERQYGLWIDHALYSHESKWFFLGKLRFQEFPLLFYGIGTDTPSEAIAQVNGLSISIRERILRQVKGSLFLGVELDYNRLSKTYFDVRQAENFTFPTGSNGSTNYGAGLGLVYDNRHNVLNVREGFFAETGFLRYDEGWGSDFSYTNYFLDMRYFLPVARTQVFATQFFANTVVPDRGSDIPFNQLALMGGENLMRGYYTGRYRDRAYLAAQAEYRFLPFPFSQRFGGAAFLGAGAVAPALRQIDLGDFSAAGGAGLRFLIFPGKDIYTRFDVAFTEEGIGYYLFIGEAF